MIAPRRLSGSGHHAPLSQNLFRHLPCYRADLDSDLIYTILRALKANDVRFKVVGGVALNLVGLPRATQDLDLFIDPTDDNVARLRKALHSVFDDSSIDEISSEDLRGDYPAIQYVPPEGAFHIDILARLGEAFDYQAIEVEERIIEEMRLPVATPLMLVRMKRDTVRPQDRADAERLRRHFKIEE